MAVLVGEGLTETATAEDDEAESDDGSPETEAPQEGAAIPTESRSIVPASNPGAGALVAPELAKVERGEPEPRPVPLPGSEVPAASAPEAGLSGPPVQENGAVTAPEPGRAVAPENVMGGRRPGLPAAAVRPEPGPVAPAAGEPGSAAAAAPETPAPQAPGTPATPAAGPRSTSPVHAESSPAALDLNALGELKAQAGPSASAIPAGALTAAGAAPAPSGLQASAPSAARVVVQQVPMNAVPIEIGMKSLAGIDRFELRLDPAELGRIDVRLDFDREGGVKAHLVVDRVETLALLQRDTRALDRAFEQAGFKPADGGIDLSLRDPSQQQGRDEQGPGRESRFGQASAGAQAEEAGVAPPPTRVWRMATGLDVRV